MAATVTTNTANPTTAMNDVQDARELSPEELEATAGGWSVSFGPFKVTGGDVKAAASWLWDHI